MESNARDRGIIRSLATNTHLSKDGCRHAPCLSTRMIRASSLRAPILAVFLLACPQPGVDSTRTVPTSADVLVTRLQSSDPRFELSSIGYRDLAPGRYAIFLSEKEPQDLFAVKSFDVDRECVPRNDAGDSGSEVAAEDMPIECKVAGIFAQGTDGFAGTFAVTSEERWSAIPLQRGLSAAFVTIKPLEGQTLPANIDVSAYAYANGGCVGSTPGPTIEPVTLK
jgi:hypothetical protein